MSLKKSSRITAVPAAQMDWLSDLPAQGLSAAQTVQWLNLWTGQGLLRHIARIGILQPPVPTPLQNGGAVHLDEPTPRLLGEAFTPQRRDQRHLRAGRIRQLKRSHCT